MSRIATNEYIGAKRRAYEASKPDKRRLILDDVCEMTGYSRKYANRLLTGSRKFKVRKGRGATYTEQDKAMLMRIWREVGCPCTTYFQANIDEWLREFRTCVAHIPDDIAAHLLSMSASMMDRLLRGVKREKPGSMQRNRRSGRNDKLLKAIECKSSELVMGCNVPPGDIQTDTVAHCGGITVVPDPTLRRMRRISSSSRKAARTVSLAAANRRTRARSLGKSPVNLPAPISAISVSLISFLFSSDISKIQINAEIIQNIRSCLRNGLDHFILNISASILA